MFRPDEVVVPRDFTEAISCILSGRVVNVGRNGHAVPLNRVLWRDGEMFIAYSDSYDVIRYDSEQTARRALMGASCIWTVTQPVVS